MSPERTTLESFRAKLKGDKARFFTEHAIPIDAQFYLPRDSTAKHEKLPCIIGFLGWTCTYELGAILLDEVDRLTRAGYAALLLNYRGYGESGSCSGQPKDVTPLEEVEDVRNAITYVQQRPEVDPERIGLLGVSFGGGISAYTAAVDERVKVTVAQWGCSNGYRWLKGQWRHYEFVDLLKVIKEFEIKMVMQGKIEYRDDLEWLCWDAKEAEWEKGWKQAGTIGGNIPFTYVRGILNFNAEEVVHKISPRPIFFIHPEVEKVIPCEESIAMYEKAREPKELWIIPKKEISFHFDVYQGLGADKGYWPEVVMPKTIGFFDRFLK